MQYLVIGGWAAIAHGLPRTTLDVDVFVRPVHDNVERLIRALSQVDSRTASELQAQEILARNVYLFADQIRIDIFTRPWGLDDFDQCWERRFEADFESVRIPFLGCEDLIRSKQTDREQDRLDAEALREIARRRLARAIGSQIRPAEPIRLR